jgi:hypothetical protein
MKITIVKKAQVANPNDKYCPFVIEGLPEPRK